MVKYECGCIAIHAGSEPVIILACDSPDGMLTFETRDMRDKTWSDMRDPDADELVDRLGILIADGNRLREIRHLLGAYK